MIILASVLIFTSTNFLNSKRTCVLLEIGVVDQVEKAFFDEVMAFDTVSLEAMDTLDLTSPDAGL